MPMDWASLIGAAAQIAGKAGAGAAAGRQTDAGNILTQNQQANQQYGTQQGAEMGAGNLDLARQNFSEQARGGRTKQSILGDMLANFQPTSIDIPGIKSATVNGGLASSMGPMSKAAGAELSRQALLKLMEGDQFSGGNVLTPPPMTATPQAGKMENILGGAGLGGSLLASVLANLKKSSGGDSAEDFMGPR